MNTSNFVHNLIYLFTYLFNLQKADFVKLISNDQIKFHMSILKDYKILTEDKIKILMW